MKKFIKFVLLLVVAGMLFMFAACSSSSGGDDEVLYTLDLTHSPYGHINVSPKGEGYSGSMKFPKGTVVTLNTSVFNEELKQFYRWFGTVASTDNTLVITMDKDYSIAVEFIDKGNRGFRAQRATNGAWYTLEAKLLGEGTYCNVYVEKDCGVTQTEAQAVAAKYDANIHDEITTGFGAHRDMDEDGKVTLLLLDIVDGYDPAVGAYVAGYFDPAHMLDLTVNLNSNECDMIFIDVNPVDVESEEFYTTIAHEFQHLINYSRTYMVDGRAQDIWINEGLSSGAEFIYSGAVSQDRVGYFNYLYSDGSRNGALAFGNNFFVWYGYWENEDPNTVLDNYATVNLFFQWLRIHASNETAIYKQILDSTNRDYQAVTAAASSQIGSTYGSWDRLLETWYLANFRCQDTGCYGYKGLIDTVPIFFSNSDDYEWEFSPGEGIISALSTDAGEVGTWDPPTGSGANIQYAGFDYAGKTVDRDSPFTNQFALVFNANTDNTDDDDIGYVANVATAPGDNPVARSMQARIDANKKPLPKKFAVGFHPGYAGSGETPEQKILKNKAGFVPLNMKQGKKGL